MSEEQPRFVLAADSGSENFIEALNRVSDEYAMIHLTSVFIGLPFYVAVFEREDVVLARKVREALATMEGMHTVSLTTTIDDEPSSTMRTKMEIG